MPFFMFPFVMWILILGGGFALASRLIRVLENRSGGSTGEVAALHERIARLEDSLENVTGQMVRLEEGQKFTMQLLDGRTPGGPAAPGEKSGPRPGAVDREADAESRRGQADPGADAEPRLSAADPGAEADPG